MGKNKKKFVDKKKAATFQLLARDSSDPNYSDGPAGDRVFVRVDRNAASYSDGPLFDEQGVELNEYDNDQDDPNGIFADAPEEDDGRDRNSGSASASALPDHVRRELLELGLPDDGYNYLLHLREIKNTGGGSMYFQNPKAKPQPLPPDVKAYDSSRVEISKAKDDSYEKSIFSVAAKTVEVRVKRAIDPEVAAVDALLDDGNASQYGSDVEDLEEDFVLNANLPEESEDVEHDKKLTLAEESMVNRKENKSNTSRSLGVGDFGSDEVRNAIHDIGAKHDKKLTLADESTVNRKENESNTSRSLGVGDFGSDEVRNGIHDIGAKPRVRRLLDEQFDLLELQEYGTDSEDEYDGAISDENEYDSFGEKLNHAVKGSVIDGLEMDGYKVLLHDKKMVEEPVSLETAADLIPRCREYAEKYENENEHEDVVIVEESSDESEIWDCETIISTYSNLDNHPGKIEAPGTRRKKKLVETVSKAFTAPTHVISLKGREKLPVDFLPQSRPPATDKVKDSSKLKNEQQQKKKLGQETKEEKKLRKAAVKEERREARRAKKDLKELYKSESQQAQKVAAFTGPSSIHLT